MNDYEAAYTSAMDDTDPFLVKKAMEIGASQMTYAEKTEAIWELFRQRREKIAEERKKKVSFALADERGKEELLRTQQRKVSSTSEGVSGEE